MLASLILLAFLCSCLPAVVGFHALAGVPSGPSLALIAKKHFLLSDYRTLTDFRTGNFFGLSEAVLQLGCAGFDFFIRFEANLDLIRLIFAIFVIFVGRIYSLYSVKFA